MRGLVVFVGGVLLGSLVQTGLAQTDRIGGVNHVGITVEHFDDAMRFFTQNMGFREAFTVRDEKGQPALAYVQVSRDTFIEVQPAGPDRRPGTITHVGLQVDNIKATLARFAQHGVKVEEARTSRTNSIIANITGPEGLRIELSELGPESLQRKAINSWK